MNDVLRIAHLRIAHQGAILRWAILTFTENGGRGGAAGGGCGRGAGGGRGD